MRSGSLETIEIDIIAIVLIYHASVCVEIDSRRSKQTANVDRSLWETHSKIYVQINCRGLGIGSYSPPSICRCAARQSCLAIRGYVEVLRLPHQVQDRG